MPPRYPVALARLAEEFGGRMPGIAETDLTLFADITLAAVPPLSVVVNEAIPASWPQVGWITIDSEVFHHSAYVAATKTFTLDLRAQQGTAAALHTAGATVGKWLTRDQWNQIVDELIAVQTTLGANLESVPTAPNLVQNSDFGRRTVFGLAMPETFTDLLGATKIDAGLAGSVLDNVFTQGAANNEYAWCTGSFVWRDGRMSAQFKAVAAAGIFALRWRINATDFVEIANGRALNTLELSKTIAGVRTVVGTIGNALTLNNWYWLEIEKQGTTFIGRIYSSGAAAAVKPATPVTTLVAAVADASVQVGAHPSITSDQATAAWGGQAASPGGVYVETWLPESWAVTFGGTLGGQAIGFDEAVDAGPIGKQWALRAYIPAASRNITLNAGNSARGNANPSTTYARSFYYKTSGLGGAGGLLDFYTVETDGAGTDVTIGATLPSGIAVAWTRVTDTRITAATARGWRPSLNINNNGTATGTVFVSLFQLEQGSAATAYRNAPADDGPMIYSLVESVNRFSTTSLTLVEVGTSSFGVNVFLPWDATVQMTFKGLADHSVLNTQISFGFSVDGVNTTERARVFSGAASSATADVTVTYVQRLAAGKHRISLLMGALSPGTARIINDLVVGALTITVTRGK